MEIFKNTIRFLVDRIIKRRSAGAYEVYLLSRRIIAAFENHDVDMVTNGERWLVRSLAKRGPLTAIDVGANQGDWAEAVLEYSPKARLLCFEPVPATFATLERAIGGPNVSLFNIALSSAPGAITIHSVADNPYIASVCAGDLYEPELRREAINLPAITGDQVIEANGLDRVTIVKIDAEGHDFDVLLGFERAVESGAIDFLQFEYNIFTLEAGRSLHNFFNLLTPKYIVCRLLPNGLEACGYHPTLENFGQSNWVAIHGDAIDGELVASLAIRRARGLPGEALRKQLQSRPIPVAVL